MKKEEAVALLERYSNYDGMGIPNLAGCKEAMKVAVDALKEAYPELSESEDERMKRIIMKFVWGYTNTPHSIINGDKSTLEYAKEVEAYLEKQKEQKPTEVDVKALLTADRLASAEMTGRLKERSEILENPEKYGLQKPAEWSEEDENMLWNIISIVGESKSIQADKMLDWLKSLRPPLKDREMKLKILKYLSTRCSSLEFEEVEDYLNNLRPSWKPSEEQISALNYFIKLWGNSDDQLEYTQIFINVKSLYEQLKKLM